MTAAAPHASPSAGASWGWLDLLLQPERFFPDGARRLGGPLRVALILVLGAAGGIARMEFAALRGVLGSSAVLAQSWPAYWGGVAAAALVAGPIGYFVGGWWFGLRLRWSGAPGADWGLARRVFLLAGSVGSLPILVFGGLDVLRYSQPAEAWNGVEPVAMTILVAPYFSIFVSYRAAMASFPLRRMRARIWFAVLPAVFYGIVTLGSAVAFALR